MSVRAYSGPHAGGRSSNGLLRVPWLLAGATIVMQIAYPLVEGQTRTTLTIATVVVFFLASSSHALLHRGLAWTLGYLVVTVGGGLFIEAVGSSTGFPFSAYDYTGTLGAKVFGVPLVIPLAWAMMAYPALAVAQRLVQSRWATALVGGVALAAWDLFLDPMMVAEGHWVWADASRQLPGIDGIPVQNFVGWLGVGIVMMALLSLLPRAPHDDRMPVMMWCWVYVSSVLANAVFLGRPSVALVGGLVMGVVAAPLAFTLWRDRP